MHANHSWVCPSSDLIQGTEMYLNSSLSSTKIGSSTFSVLILRFYVLRLLTIMLHHGSFNQVSTKLKIGYKAQSAPSGWDRINRSVKTWAIANPALTKYKRSYFITYLCHNDVWCIFFIVFYPKLCILNFHALIHCSVS